jgi:hypothetical protein
MAAVANQVHSTAQQIGARIGWNPIDAATQPPVSETMKVSRTGFEEVVQIGNGKSRRVERD